MRLFEAVLCAWMMAAAYVVRAQSPEPEAEAIESAKPKQNPFLLGGYVEAVYQWNFNRPWNGITNYRGFDNRHNSFTLSNIALDVQWDHADLVGRVTLQVGHTPSTYYASEPSLAAATGASATNAELWKYVQQAYVGYRFQLERELTVAAGIFLSPIGPEAMAVYDNWNWSRSNLFFGLPFYHTGVRATYSLSEVWSLQLAGYNGWNSVVDNNSEKSLSGQLLYTQPELNLSVLYFGGVERARDAPEGRGFRHLFDAHMTWYASPRWSFRAEANVGFEPTRFGTSHWQAAALYARAQVLAMLYVAVRADAFFEHAAGSGARRASPLFWPAGWVSSGTLTCDYRPHDRVSLRIEYRRDQAASDTYFGRRSEGDDGSTMNRASQDTLSIGATSWF
jgi:hypothetical protein